MTQGGESRKTRPMMLDLRTVPTSDDQRIRLLLPDRSVYVGQRVPVTLEWWYKGRLSSIARPSSVFRSDDLDLSKAHLWIRVPLFFLDDAFDFVNEEVDGRRDLLLPIETPGGRGYLKAEHSVQVHAGERYNVFTAQRTLIPVRAGSYDLEPASVTLEVVTRWERNFFENRPAATQRYRNVDVARKLVVKEPPLAGRPESYAGAIGKGFTLSVSADRTVVRAGEGVTLTLVVRGDGNLPHAGLPPLDADGGLSPDDFRVPGPDVAGILDEEQGTKTFRVTVRVLSESVTEIPPIAYSWFDVERGRYETTRARPVALSVSRAEVIDAGSVVSGSRERGPDLDSVPADVSRSRPRFQLHDADLAIETRPERVLRDARRRFGGSAVVYGLYAAPMLLLALAALGRRRAAIDPAIARRRKALNSCRQRIAGAAGRPRVEGTAEIAAALREMLIHRPEARGPEVEAFLAECEAVVYAPDAEAGVTLEAGFHERAAQLAAAIEGGDA